MTYDSLESLLSDFHGCACAIAKKNAFPSDSAVLMLTGSISVSFHRSIAARLAMSMKSALPFHGGLEISRTFTVWESNVVSQTEKSTESLVLPVHCK